MVLLPDYAVANKSTIYWHTYHRPPTSIKSGPLVGLGMIDRVLEQIIYALPDYQHALPLTSPTRTIADMNNGKQVCHPAFIKTEEREKFAFFSKPSLVAPSIRLVGLTLPQNTEQNKVTLGNASLGEYSTFIFNRGRSYGQKVDDFLRQVPRGRKMFFAADKTTELFNLVVNQKVDFTFSYPIEVNYFNQHHKDNPLKAWLIDGVPPYLLGYVACSKTAWGEQVISAINQTLIKIVDSPSYFSAMTSWLPEERKKPAFLDFYQNEFLSQHE